MHPEMEKQMEIDLEKLRQRAFATAVRCSGVFKSLEENEPFIVTELWLRQISGMRRITEVFFRFLQQSMVKKGAFIAEISDQVSSRRFLILPTGVVSALKVDPESPYVTLPKSR